MAGRHVEKTVIADPGAAGLQHGSGGLEREVRKVVFRAQVSEDQLLRPGADEFQRGVRRVIVVEVTELGIDALFQDVSVFSSFRIAIS